NTSGGTSGTPVPPGSSPDGSSNPALCDTASATACSGQGRKCNPALGCVECIADTDCATGGRDPFCVRGRCEACRTNADCGVAAPICYPGDHRCHVSCAIDGGARCGLATPHCDTATGACVGCLAPTDCPPPAPLCESTTKACVVCEKNSDCPATRPKCDPL